jgi:xanthine dehydrogenase YagS FAD-binding subunit
VNPFEYARPGSVPDALRLLVGPGVAAKAGGVDLLELMKEGVIAPGRLIQLGGVRELAFVRETGDWLELGPLTTVAELAQHPLVRKHAPLLAEAAGHVATPQIRNMATLGGNLLQRPRCWYFRSADFACRKKGGATCFAQAGESQLHALLDNHVCAIVHPSTLATALSALEATVAIAGPKGRREIPIEQLFVSPSVDVTREHMLAADELLVEVRVPSAGPAMQSAFTKQGERESYDWPLAEAAVALELEAGRCRRARLVLGAIAPVPHRARAAEAELVGKALDAETATRAARTPLAGNRYKVPIFEAVIKRTLLSARGGR